MKLKFLRYYSIHSGTKRWPIAEILETDLYKYENLMYDRGGTSDH